MAKVSMNRAETNHLKSLILRDAYGSVLANFESKLQFLVSVFWKDEGVQSLHVTSALHNSVLSGSRLTSQ